MAKIRISGMFELVEGPEDEAKAIDQMKKSGAASNTYVAFGNWRGALSEVKGVFFEAESRLPKGPNYALLDYENQVAYSRLTPREKAEKCAWGPFSLFYYGVYGKAPVPDLKPRVLEVAEKFYDEYPLWTAPSLKVWYDLLGIPHDTPIEDFSARILLRVEAYQIDEEKVEKSEVKVE